MQLENIERDNSGGRTSLSISVVIPCYNRRADLMDALGSLLEQTVLPIDIIIVDDSTTDEIEIGIQEITGRFRTNRINLRYRRNPGRRSLPKSRNLGVEMATGDIILFLDDDVLLDSHYIENIIRVYESHPEAKGVQGYWGMTVAKTIGARLTNCYNRVFSLWQYRKNKCIVLQTFEPVYPEPLTETINCQWLSGCNQSYPKHIFSEFKFDGTLQRYAPGEDIDFSLRVGKSYRHALFVTPAAKLVHRSSRVSRTPNSDLALMQEVYHEYLFFKNIEQRRRNRILFAWNRFGALLYTLLSALAHSAQTKRFDFRVARGIFIARLLCANHRKQIKNGDLEFLDKLLEV